MANLSTRLQSKLLKLPGSVYGYLSIGVGLIGDLLAISLFPGFNLSYMISALGAGPGGIFFNLGLTFSGVFALFFYIYLVRVVQTDFKNNKILKFAKYSSINSCVFYSLIGVFPAIMKYDILILIHGLIVAISWISACIYLISFGILFLKSTIFLKFHGYLSFVTATTFLIVLFTWNPITEWIMTFSIILWIAVIASYTSVERIHSKT